MSIYERGYHPDMDETLLEWFHQLGKTRTIAVLHCALGHMQSYNGQSEGSAIAKGMFDCLSAKEHIALSSLRKRIIGVPDAPKKRKRKRIPVSYK